MAWLWKWLTRNWADTAESGDSRIVPQRLNLSPLDALQKVRAAVERLPRWRVESADPERLTLKAIRQTRMFRFVDDVTIRLATSADGGTELHARSQSRVGKGDFGQNRRNLLELFAALNEHDDPRERTHG
jgi:uncharacterized protein (DUF1499 family)